MYKTLKDEKLKEVFAFMKAQEDAEKAGEKEFKCPLCGGRAWWDWAKINNRNHLYYGCEKCGYRLRI